MNKFEIERAGLKGVLSDEEFEQYYKSYKTGDITARNIIIERNIKLVISIVNNYFSAFRFEREDMISVGLTSLITALEHYELNKGTRFSTYATKCVRNGIAMYCAKRIKESSGILSLDKEYNSEDSDNETDFYNFVNIKEPINNNSFEDKDYLNYLLETLTSYERDIIEMYYGFGKYNKSHTEQEVANKLNCSKQWIDAKMKKILRDLKLAAENEENRKKLMLKKGK